MASKDIILGRRGDSVTGTVLNKHFTMSTDLGKITIPTAQINQIRFKGTGSRPHEITLVNRDTMRGTIQEESVRFRRDGDAEAIEVPASSILMVLISWAGAGGTFLKAHFE